MSNLKFKPVQSLQRGLAIIEAVARRHDGASLKELAAAAGCSPPAAFHLVQTLVVQGYLHRIESPSRYVLGQKLHLLVHNQRQDRFYTVVYQQMYAIHRQLPEASVYFVQYVSEQMLIRSRLIGQMGSVLQHEVNTPLPPYVSAGSVVHLAYWSPDQQRQYVDTYNFDVYGRLFWDTWDDFARVLKETREQGSVLIPEKIPSHLRLGFPVLGATGMLQGVITIQWNRPTKEGLAGRKKQLRTLATQVMQQIARELKG